MDLSVKDVAKLLKVSDKTIYRFLKNEAIPSIRVGGQWRFKREEIISWLEDAKESAAAANEGKELDDSEEGISISRFLQRGGVFYRIGGDSKEAVIRESLAVMKPGLNPSELERLYNAIMERERLCSTGIGHGVALPHPRRFNEFPSPLSSICLCFLEKPVYFQAVDGKDANLLFFIFPKNEERYLKIQSKLLRLLREEDVLAGLREVPLREDIYNLFLQAEEKTLAGAR
ncbi:MAG: PTS sugar transporter subunit IIA [Nitrospinae bacterium]|nr:PTS sugar transporter subunit IIA [Nitrospinota bacterium]